MNRSSKENLTPKTPAERMRVYRKKQKEKLSSEEARQRESEAKRKQRKRYSSARIALVNFKRRQKRLNAVLEREVNTPGSSQFILKNPYSTASSAGMNYKKKV